MKHQSIAACVITNDAWRGEEIRRLMESIEPHVDGVFVSYNGKKSRLPRWSQYTSLPISWGRSRWVSEPLSDDPEGQWAFSAARQASYDIVPRDEYQWYLWIDTDDVLVVNRKDGIQPMFDELDDYSAGVFSKYEYGIEPNTGECVIEQWRERMMSTSFPWRWKYPVHEVCASAFGVQWSRRDDFHIRHQRVAGEDRGARDRNRHIIAIAMRVFPNESRYRFYFANESLGEALATKDPAEKAEKFRATIHAYRSFISIAPATDDAYLAQCRLADTLYELGDYHAAVDEYLQAVKFYPSWPDGFVGIARCCMMLKDFGRMREFAELASKCGKPETVYAIEPHMASFQPLVLRGIANEALGYLEQARDDYIAAKAIWDPPPSEFVGGEGALAERIEEIDAQLSSPAEEVNEVRKRTRGTKPSKSIAFFTNPVAQAWHPKTAAESGAGGVETCCMEISRRFAADGWRAVVFGMPGPYRGIADDGVEYWNSDEWRAAEEFTLAVGVRAPNMLESHPAAKHKLLWLHDVNVGARMTGPHLDAADAVVCLSPWQKQYHERLYLPQDANMVVIPNGVIPERYPIEALSAHEGPQFVYSSSPDRGVDVLLGMWPAIRKRWPDATVDVFYGWNFIDSLIDMTNGQHPLVQFKQAVMGAIERLGGEEGGIRWRDRVTQDELATYLQQCHVWTHPTYFMETFCITAVEMQMAGVIPLTTKLAALETTVGDPGLLVEGWPNNVTYQRAWIEKLESLMGMPSYERRMLRKQLRAHAEQFTWDASYSMWRDLIRELEGKARQGAASTLAVA